MIKNNMVVPDVNLRASTQEFSANCNMIYIETDKEKKWGQYTHPTDGDIINYITCHFITICVFLLKTWSSFTRA